MLSRLLSPRLPVIALLVSFVLVPVEQPLVAQQDEEKSFRNLTVGKCESTLKSLGKKGFVLDDIAVDSGNKKKVRFAMRLIKPSTPVDQHVRLKLSDKEFLNLYEQSAQKKFRVHCHETYKEKGKTLHAVIWRFDGKFIPPPTKTSVEDPEPKARPLTKIWDSSSRVPVDGLEPGPHYRAIDEAAIKFIKVNQLPGVTIASALRGELVYQRAFGYSDVDRKTKFRVDQPVRSLGISRLVTAVAILQLVDEGELSLDQKVFPLLDHIKARDPETVDSNLNKMTVLHLLQDSGGYDVRATKFNPPFNTNTIAAAMKVPHPISREAMISYVMSQPLAFVPGEAGAHSDFGYCVLGRVIEKVSGVSYEEYVKKNIFKPLGLESFEMGHGDLERRANNEVSYYSRSGRYYDKVTGKEGIGTWVQAGNGGTNMDLLDSAAGWVATPKEMLAFATFIQQTPSPILSVQSKKQLIARPRYVLEKPNGDKQLVWMGCGVQCRELDGGVSFWTMSNMYCAGTTIVCFGNGVSNCFAFNCNRTATAKSPESLFNASVVGETQKARLRQGK